MILIKDRHVYLVYCIFLRKSGKYDTYQGSTLLTRATVPDGATVNREI